MVSQQTIEGLQQGEWQVKLRAGGYYNPVKIKVEDGRLLFFFKYNAALIKEIKESFEGRRWHGFIEGDERKIWSAPITHRNLFQLESLLGKYAQVSPYAHWSLENDYTDVIKEHCVKRNIPIYDHQVQMINLNLNSHWCIDAAEMGTGKTLAAMLTMELAPFEGDAYWVGPKAPLVAVKADFRKWKCPIIPEFITYNRLVKIVDTWEEGQKPPRFLILDESSKCKNPKSQRSQAAQNMADFMRDTWGWDNCFILLLSGSPAPKAPSDWWKQAEIASPGFIREANLFVFRERLAHIYKEESIPGVGGFNKLHTWKDSEEKCAHCGEIKDHPNHEKASFGEMLMQKNSAGQTFEVHEFKPGVNEVEDLGRRLKGLAQSWMKKDCLDLPEKRYKTIEVEPSSEVLNAAKIIVETTTRAVDALTRLRTLSDGFLYEYEKTGTTSDCGGCNATGKVLEYFEPDNPYDVLEPEEVERGVRFLYEECPPDEDPVEFVPEKIGERSAEILSREVDCYTCDGKGQIEDQKRIITEVECPKIGVLVDLLEEHEEVGRLNVFAGFEGSIIRVVNECLRQGWSTLKVDGKGWQFTHPNDGVLNISDDEMLDIYQNGQANHSKITFVGQPGAAGMGLTLTASPSTFFYSNSFNPEDRQQAEDRGHRIGMDIVRGGVIIDCVHLPTDVKVINALRQSKMLQKISMDSLRMCYAA